MSATMRIPTEFTAIDKFTSVVSKMTSGVSNFSNTSTAAIDRFNTKANKISGQMALAGGAIVGGFGLAVNSASSFEKSMSNVSTLLDTNVEDMDKMSKEVLNLSKTLPVPIEELTASLYDIRSAGIPAKDAMQALATSGKLAKAGLSSTSEATNILTSAMNAFKSEGLSSDEIANLLFKTVKAGKTNMADLSQAFGANAAIIQSAGVKLSDFQAATAALTVTGAPASQAQNQLKASIVALQKPTAEMTKIFKKLGVSSEKDLIAKEGSLVGAFNAVNKAGTGMGINLAKAWSSTEASSAVTGLLGANNQAYIDTLKDMQSGTDALTGAFAKQQETTASKVQLAKNNMEALSITIGTQVAPILSSLIDVITPIITSFTTWISENPKLTKTIAFLGLGLLGLSAIIKGVTFATTAWSVAQTVLNFIMTANPIGIIIVAIAAMVALIIGAIAYWEDWGAAILLMTGPIGWIINLFMSLRKHWDSIVEAFSSGGIIEGFKRLGAVILDSVLYPVQQLLGMLAKIPGVGTLLAPALKGIEVLREKLGVSDEKKTVEVVTPKQETMKNQSEMKGNINMTINDRQNNVGKIESDFGGIGVNTTKTQGAF